MTEIERKNILILADTIKGEINRMCTTKDIEELDAMALCAQGNIEQLLSIRYNDFKEQKHEKSCNTCYHNKTEFSVCQYCTDGDKYEEYEEKNCNTCNNYDKRNGCVGIYDYMCECTDNDYKHWTPY